MVLYTNPQFHPQEYVLFRNPITHRFFELRPVLPVFPGFSRFFPVLKTGGKCAPAPGFFRLGRCAPGFSRLGRCAPGFSLWLWPTTAQVTSVNPCGFSDSSGLTAAHCLPPPCLVVL